MAVAPANNSLQRTAGGRLAAAELESFGLVNQRWRLISMVGLLLVVVWAWPVPSLARNGKPSIQKQCGVKMGRPITDSQALCIARLAGFDHCLYPPQIVPAGGSVAQPDTEWVVNCTDRGCPAKPTGREMAGGVYMVIRKSDGRVMRKIAWDGFCRQEGKP